MKKIKLGLLFLVGNLLVTELIGSDNFFAFKLGDKLEVRDKKLNIISQFESRLDVLNNQNFKIVYSTRKQFSDTSNEINRIGLLSSQHYSNDDNLEKCKKDLEILKKEVDIIYDIPLKYEVYTHGDDTSINYDGKEGNININIGCQKGPGILENKTLSFLSLNLQKIRTEEQRKKDIIKYIKKTNQIEKTVKPSKIETNIFTYKIGNIINGVIGKEIKIKSKKGYTIRYFPYYPGNTVEIIQLSKYNINNLDDCIKDLKNIQKDIEKIYKISLEKKKHSSYKEHLSYRKNKFFVESYCRVSINPKTKVSNSSISILINSGKVNSERNDVTHELNRKGVKTVNEEVILSISKPEKNTQKKQEVIRDKDLKTLLPNTYNGAFGIILGNENKHIKRYSDKISKIISKNKQVYLFDYEVIAEEDKSILINKYNKAVEIKVSPINPFDMFSQYSVQFKKGEDNIYRILARKFYKYGDKDLCQKDLEKVLKKYSNVLGEPHEIGRENKLGGVRYVFDNKKNRVNIGCFHENIIKKDNKEDYFLLISYTNQEDN